MWANNWKKMTIKNAIKILDWWITQREKSMKKIEADDNFNDKGISAILIKSDKTVISNLQLIRKELIPNCKHPKKMQDTCAGVKYCTKCNTDL